MVEYAVFQNNDKNIDSFLNKHIKTSFYGNMCSKKKKDVSKQNVNIQKNCYILI